MPIKSLIFLLVILKKFDKTHLISELYIIL